MCLGQRVYCRPLGEWPGGRLARAVAVPGDKSPSHKQTPEKWLLGNLSARPEILLEPTPTYAGPIVKSAHRNPRERTIRTGDLQ